MTQLEFAAKLLRIEAFIIESRSHTLLGNQQMAIGALVSAKREINKICEDILSLDETKMYLAK